ncbi:MAG: TonB-dependent receptor [Bacteroidales bacterium]|nr:TonB-dependent receptor [Bacteroidales bacterium]
MKRIGILSILLFMTMGLFAQQTITGKVTNNEGEILIGANVLIKETYKGTATNSDGMFKFSRIRSGTYTFSISYLGYKSLEKEVLIPSKEKLVFILENASILSDEVIITATRAKKNDPVSVTNISNAKIKENNFGQDIPYLLSSTPSIVSTSDAGAGVGYTNFRIRGTDLNRINITVNGIPLNDSESHGVWFVNMPDFMSSLNNIQIQRGVGTSSNGAAAFGASLNLQTKTFNKDAYAEINSFAGSFNTLRNSASFGTGLLNNKFTFDGRISKISSDGFIDRAESDLESFYLSGTYYTSRSLLKANIISGKEKTYQSWNGVPSVRLNNDAQGMELYRDHGLISEEEYDEMVASNSRTYNIYTYDNETDNYQQDHYQLFYSFEFNPNLHLNTAAHYTRGKGYYEQYKKNRKFEDYQLEDVIISTDTISRTDLVQQKWLDNHFYGGVFSLDYQNKNLNLTFGGGWNKYDGDHYGEVIWAKYASNGDINHRWYESNGLKEDLNVYSKINYTFFNKLTSYVDLQYRKINYEIDGIDDDLRDITQTHNFDFFNPKLGLSYKMNDIHSAYLTFGVANREPTRSNYTDADTSKEEPTFETLFNAELGYNLNATNGFVSANLYYMYYNDQLVLTGEINDVGNPIMTNVDKSYRMGIEIAAGVKLFKKLELNANATFSENKIEDFTEYVDNWDTWEQESKNLGKTDLSFSPNVIINGNISWEIIKHLKADFISKFVSRQYIDNTSNKDRSIDPYFISDVKLSYTIKTKAIKEIGFNLLINNIFNYEYESNAWVYRYTLDEQEYKMDGYFPQAGINILGGISLKF